MKKIFTILTLTIVLGACSKGTPPDFVPNKVVVPSEIPVEEITEDVPGPTVDNGCLIVVKKEDISMSWVAFKTPDKVGVTGTFTDLGISDEFRGTGVSNLFNSISFNIDTETTELGSALKNTNVIETFFRLMSDAYISGSFEGVSDEKVNLKVNMNNIEKVIPMKLTYTKDSINGSAIMDVFDFSLQSSLNGVNERCYDYHAGKTWNDVELHFSMKYTLECNN